MTTEERIDQERGVSEYRFLASSLAPIGLEPQLKPDQPRRIVGYAAVFYDGTERTQCSLRTSKDGRPLVVERILPIAFDRDLGNLTRDVTASWNHRPEFILGRRSTGTLRLSADNRGLRYEIDPPDTQYARDLLTSIERGDVAGSSFGFEVRANGEFWERDNGLTVRTIKDLSLLDVGPATNPAYVGSSVGLRALDPEEALASMAAWEAREEGGRRKDEGEEQGGRRKDEGGEGEEKAAQLQAQAGELAARIHRRQILARARDIATRAKAEG